jgi:cytochrome P450
MSRMQTIDELELPWLGLEDPETWPDPFAQFNEARAQHPWLAKCSFGYAVTSYAAMREVMEHDDVMSVGYRKAVEAMGALDTPWGQFIAHALQGQNGDLHTRLRSALAPAFTPREANRHRWIMREEMARLLDEWGPQGELDFERFASHFPVSVMCRIIGQSPKIVPEIRDSLEILGLGGSLEPAYLPRLQESFGHVDGMVRDLVAGRRREGTGSHDDLLDKLLEITAQGGLSDDELYNILVFLFVGGYDTSKNVLSLIMHLMIDRPEMYARCAEDLEYCHKVVHETLRYHGVASSPRLLLEDITVRDVHFPKGTMLFMPWSVSGRDPGSFRNADVFDPERERDTPIMPFGLGPHMCLGQYIARAQIEEGLHLVARRIANPRRAGANGWREFVGVWGLRGFPIAFDYRPAQVAAA